MVVVTKLDRATRSLKDLAEIIETFEHHQVAFVSLGESIDTSTATGRMFVNFLGLLAQFERERIGERTSEVLASKRRKREVYGRVPFGWERVGDRIAPVPAIQKVLAEMKRRDAAGDSFRSIGTWLTTKRVKPPRGRKWHAASVRAVLRSQIATEAA